MRVGISCAPLCSEARRRATTTFLGKDVFGSIGARSVPVDQVAGGRLQRAARGAIMRTFPAGGLKDRRNDWPWSWLRRGGPAGGRAAGRPFGTRGKRPVCGSASASGLEQNRCASSKRKLTGERRSRCASSVPGTDITAPSKHSETSIAYGLQAVNATRRWLS